MKRKSIHLDPDQHQQFKIYAAQIGWDMDKLIKLFLRYVFRNIHDFEKFLGEEEKKIE